VIAKTPYSNSSSNNNNQVALIALAAPVVLVSISSLSLPFCGVPSFFAAAPLLSSSLSHFRGQKSTCFVLW